MYSIVKTLFVVSFSLLSLLWLSPVLGSSWQVSSFEMQSSAIADNKLGVSATRSIRVWLPPSYASSPNKRYPVIYYLHNYGWSNQQMDEVEQIHTVFERAHQRGQTREFIFVAGDFTAHPLPGTFYGNNSVVGGWFDHIEQELVPTIDQRFRTLAKPESRGLAGDFIGGYAALRFAMHRPGVFSSVYALHPVGVGIGERLMRMAPDWRALNAIKTKEDLLSASGANLAFVLMAQSFAPQIDTPPLYAKLIVEDQEGSLLVNPEATRAMHKNFILRTQIPERLDELNQLRGLMFDWGRYDGNIDHVHGARKFANELEEYQIPHFAEEYRGNQWDEKWVPYGRVEDRLLPFFNRFLEFE